MAGMAVLPNLVNADLKRGFTVPQVAEKHGWTEPMVWSVALEEDLLSWTLMNLLNNYGRCII